MLQQAVAARAIARVTGLVAGCMTDRVVGRLASRIIGRVDGRVDIDSMSERARCFANCPLRSRPYDGLDLYGGYLSSRSSDGFLIDGYSSSSPAFAAPAPAFAPAFALATGSSLAATTSTTDPATGSSLRAAASPSPGSVLPPAAGSRSTTLDPISRLSYSVGTDENGLSIPDSCSFRFGITTSRIASLRPGLATEFVPRHSPSCNLEPWKQGLRRGGREGRRW